MKLIRGKVFVALKINIRCSKPVSDHKIAIVSMGWKHLQFPSGKGWKCWLWGE